MIDSLTGKILEKTPGEVVVRCGGVGYLAFIPSPDVGALPAVGEEATVYTAMCVSENDVSLYGFASRASRAMFRMLTGVSGVGPKVGINILSALPPERIALAVSAGDFKALTAASGVGPKLAQRLVLELKDKIAKGMGDTGSFEGVAAIASAADSPGAAGQAVAALVSLGYTASEAASAVAAIDPNLPTAEIIRLALRGMGGR